jgi:hypothetical protein
MITVMVHILNDVQEEGGETHFPKLDSYYYTKERRCCRFFITLLLKVPPATHIQKLILRSMHAGMPVINGEKWMVNLAV